MNKHKETIRRIFKKNYKFNDVICYKNPNECSSFNIERVNPDHVGIIWGKRKKTSKGNNTIMIGKVYFSIIPLAYGLMVAGYLDALTSYAYSILANIGILSCILGVIAFIGIPINPEHIFAVAGLLTSWK